MSTPPVSRSFSSTRSGASHGTDETTELLRNECSTPLRRPSPTRHSNLASTLTPSHLPPKEPPSLATPSYLLSPEQNRRALDPSLARRASMTLSPESRGRQRRLSNASLVRSRSIADIGDGEGKLTRDRILALMCVCVLSVGSHFTSNILGPIKSQLHRELGSTNSQFSLLISALSLNSTWTPLVGGILVSRFGTAWSSVVCTGAVLLGEIILYYGTTHGLLPVMACGLFLFGMGVSPLAVVQETLLARLSPGGHLGLSLALGLVSGKTASFISALVSKPLAERGGSGLPFFVALVLCLGSFSANLARLAFGWGEPRDRHEQVSAKRIVKWDGLSRLGDVFYVFIIINMLCGAIWSPFMHLSANIIQLRFDLPEEKAALQASVLLSGSMVLYPIVGYITDAHGSTSPRTTFKLFHITSILTLIGYVALSLPVSIVKSAWPGLIPWALGHGASPLLLVVLAARILPVDLVPLGLGMHKALETAASTGTQTIAGLYLDYAKNTHGGNEGGDEAAAHSLLLIFAALNVAQLLGAALLWKFEHMRRHAPTRGLNTANEYERLPLDDDERRIPLHIDNVDSDTESIDFPGIELLDDDKGPTSGLARTDAERQRARISFKLCLAFIASVWILFFSVVWAKL